MKLIEKRCPNCGAGLSFDKDDHEVTCEYCKKSYIIQKDESKINNFNNENQNNLKYENHFDLIQKRNNIAIIIVYIIIFFTIIIGLFITCFFDLVRENSKRESKDESQVVETKKDVYVSSFDQIDETSLEIFQKESLSKLNDSTFKVGKNITLSDYEYVGMYLLCHKTNDGNELYDIYKRRVVGDNIDMYVYATVYYTDLKLSDDNIVLNSFNGRKNAPFLYLTSDMLNYGYGYDSLEELYNKVLRNKTSEYTIMGTDGLYIEN